MPDDSATKGVPQFMGITFGSGDFVSLFSLFFDNLSTLLGLGGAILGLSSTSTILTTIVYERIVPAAGVMLFFGNAYYTFQAIRMRNKFNKSYTAQPYGTYSLKQAPQLCSFHAVVLTVFYIGARSLQA